ncbi:hypothetical protein N9M50_00080 [Alphaproteobacteria bacterium]|nr:hypothetical protein [Alphaproteobacteria bacterium]
MGEITSHWRQGQYVERSVGPQVIYLFGSAQALVITASGQTIKPSGHQAIKQVLSFG